LIIKKKVNLSFPCIESNGLITEQKQVMAAESNFSACSANTCAINLRTECVCSTIFTKSEGTETTTTHFNLNVNFVSGEIHNAVLLPVHLS